MQLKVALYFNSFGISGIDLRKPEIGNPGVGGTHFNFITLPYYFNRHYPGEIEWFVLGPDNNLLPEGINVINLIAHEKLDELLKKHQFDYFIWKPADEIPNMVETLTRNNQPGIAWCHNIPTIEQLQEIADSEIVKLAVWAGHEALEVVRDHKIINKSTVIFNGFDPSPYTSNETIQKDPNSVVYLGSLYPAKCFHLLAEAWPLVLKEKPDAKLTVIGSGKLYNRNAKLGPFGLAQESYEQKFITPLLNDQGDIIESVTFAGLLGSEKVPIMQRASVGVINPHGMSEVCPGSAIEFHACQTPVVAGARYGNLDVIANDKNGLLVKNIQQLAESIIKILKNPKLRDDLGKNGKQSVLQLFDQQKIVSDWKNVFEMLRKDSYFEPYPMKKNWSYNLKILFEMLRIIKFEMGLFPNAPSLYELIERVKRKRQK